MWIPTIEVLVCDCVHVFPHHKIIAVEKKAGIDYHGYTCCSICNTIYRHGAQTTKNPKIPEIEDTDVQLKTLPPEVKPLKQDVKDVGKEMRRFCVRKLFKAS